MVIDRDRQPTSDARRGRWLPIGSFLLATVGVVVLVNSLVPPPATVMEMSAVPDRHATSSPAAAVVVPGLALHPGPQVAILAAELDPDIAPAALRAIAVPIVATPSGFASPGADHRSP
jgi:hypothetical protein